VKVQPLEVLEEIGAHLILDLARDGVDDEAGAELENAGSQGDPNDEQGVAAQVGGGGMAAKPVNRLLENEWGNEGDEISDDDEDDPQEQNPGMPQQIFPKGAQKRPQDLYLQGLCCWTWQTPPRAKCETALTIYYKSTRAHAATYDSPSVS